MSITSKAFDEELKGVGAALRRAALKAKQEAERLGVPYVVRDSSNAKFLSKDQKNAKTK